MKYFNTFSLVLLSSIVLFSSATSAWWLGDRNGNYECFRTDDLEDREDHGWDRVSSRDISLSSCESRKDRAENDNEDNWSNFFGESLIGGDATIIKDSFNKNTDNEYIERPVERPVLIPRPPYRQPVLSYYPTCNYCTNTVTRPIVYQKPVYRPVTTFKTIKTTTTRLVPNYSPYTAPVSSSSVYPSYNMSSSLYYPSYYR